MVFDRQVNRAGTATRAGLSGYARYIIRFVTTQLMDPHRYFEQQWLGRLAACESDAELWHCMEEIIGWFDSGLLETRQLERLDRELAEQGWMTLSDARANLQALRALLTEG